MLFMVAALLLSFPRVWRPRARRLLSRPEPGEGTRPRRDPSLRSGRPQAAVPHSLGRLH